MPTRTSSRAVRREPGEGLLVKRAPLAVGGGAVRGLLGEHRDAEADQPAVRLAALLPGPDGRQVDRFDRHAQELADSRRCRNACR